MTRKIAIALFVLFFFSCHTSVHTSEGVDRYHYSILKDSLFTKGAVASAHPLASEIGAQVLKNGGNAVDAAIAVQFALAVVYPQAGNIGGGGFMIVHTKEGENVALDYRETAPAAATRDMFLDEAGEADADLSLNGPLSAGVPGTVAGLFKAHERFGERPMKELIDPAIVLARKGFAVTPLEASNLNWNKKAFVKYNTRSSAFVKEEDWKAGDTLIQEDLAHTLDLIREKGKDGFYKGETAGKIVEEMERGGGIMTLEDLEKYKAIERQPRIFDYKGHSIVTMPLPSSGGIALQQLFGLIKEYPIAEYGFNSAKAVQLMVEAERRAYADRASFLGDPDFVDVPIEKLVDPEYLKEKFSDFTFDRAGVSEDIETLQWTENEETTHLSVVDKDGNAVSVTYTLNNTYGSKTVVGGAGFFLNDEMDDFSAKPGSPNLYGLIGTEANAIEPGKRMLSSMSPTIVLKQDKPYLVLGTPGGSTIITSVFQTIVDLIDFDLSVKEAVNTPKFHHQWKPDLIYLEKGFPDSTKQALEKKGYRFEQRNAIGRTEVIRLSDEILEAVADGRGDDAVAGY